MKAMFFLPARLNLGNPYPTAVYRPDSRHYFLLPRPQLEILIPTPEQHIRAPIGVVLRRLLRGIEIRDVVHDRTGVCRADADLRHADRDRGVLLLVVFKQPA